MKREQQAARVNVSDDEWLDFRTLAMRKHRSIADYLGELVRRELKQAAPTPPAEPPPEKDEPSCREPKRGVRLADQKLFTGFTHRRPEPPPWEE